MLVRLNRQLTFQHRTETQDEFGQPIETWTDEKEPTWTNRRDLTGRERFAADQVQPFRMAIFTIRYRSDLNEADWRIDHEDLIWDINGVAELRDTRGQYLEVTATAIGVP